MEGNEAMKMKGEGTGMDNVIQRERESKSIFLFFFPRSSTNRFLLSVKVDNWPVARPYWFTLQSTWMGQISVITQFISVVS